MGKEVAEADVKGMTVRDVLMIQSESAALTGNDWPALTDDMKAKLKDTAAPRDAIDAIRELATNLKARWDGEDPWLVTVTANKSLRFTAPGNAPVEVWATLTWMAPALLFSFLNRAVCQAIHVAALQPQAEGEAASSKAHYASYAPGPVTDPWQLKPASDADRNANPPVPRPDPPPEFPPQKEPQELKEGTHDS